MSENIIKYRQHGDYLLPELEIPDSPHIGVWGERRRRYLREHLRGLYSGMLLNGKRNAHLEETDRQAEAMFFQLAKQLSAALRKYLTSGDYPGISCNNRERLISLSENSRKCSFYFAVFLRVFLFKKGNRANRLLSLFVKCDEIAMIFAKIISGL